MSDRREPTISGTRVEHDDVRRSSGRSGERPRNSRSASSHAPQRPVIVRSKIAPLAFLLAIAAGAAAGYLGWEGFKLRNELVLAADRIKILEEKLVMTDDETSASAAAMQASLKEAHSEIRKLWGVSYDTNRKGISDNKNQIASAKKQAAAAVKNANAVKSEITRVESLIEAQKTSMNAVEQSAATISAQARALNEKNARAEQKLEELKSQISGIEQDIEAINGFRRSVNQQLLQLNGGTAQ